MQRIGQITARTGKHAMVEIKKHSSCGDCNQCHHGEEDQPLITEVLNDIDAPMGAFVEIDMPDKDVLRAAFIVYLLPLLSMLAAIALSFFIIHLLWPSVNPELFSVAIGVVALLATYFGIRWWEDRSTEKERYMAHVIRVVDMACDSQATENSAPKA